MNKKILKTKYYYLSSYIYLLKEISFLIEYIIFYVVTTNVILKLIIMDIMYKWLILIINNLSTIIFIKIK